MSSKIGIYFDISLNDDTIEPMRKKPGPKPKPDAHKLLSPLLIRLRHQDRRLLNAAARARGVAVTVYIRDAALDLARGSSDA